MHGLLSTTFAELCGSPRQDPEYIPRPREMVTGIGKF